ncbi:MAG: hypothetical protein KKI08_27185 [Armatimonadetes bacterium]|nr:hypothetical protein [Armatimonadota bacterium]
MALGWRLLPALGLLLCAHVGAANLLRNPGFEAGLDGWQSGPVPAQIVAVAHEGAQAALLRGDVANPKISLTQVVPCKPQTKYLISAWSRGDGLVSVEGWFTDAKGKPMVDPLCYVPQDGPRGLHDWTRTACQVETPAGTTHLMVLLRLTGTYEEVTYLPRRWALFDEVELTESEQTQNLLTDGGMEPGAYRDTPDGWYPTVRANNGPGLPGPGKWVLDPDRPWEGTSSLRNDLPNTDVRSLPVRCHPARAYTFSVHLRAAEPVEIPAYIHSDPGGMVLTKWQVGTEWQRYSMTRRVPDDARTVRVSIMHPPRQLSLWIDAAKLETGETATPYVSSLPRLIVPPMAEARAVEVTLQPGALERRAAPAATAAPGVQVDVARRCMLLDGKPFLGVALLNVPLEALPEATRVHANVVILNHSLLTDPNDRWDPTRALPAVRAYLDRAHALGLRAIIWPSLLHDADYRSWHEDAKRRQWTETMIEGLREHPALLAWMVTDEPHTVPPEWTERLYRFFKERDPAHPSFINLGCGTGTDEYARNYYPSSDLGAIDYYPVAWASSIENVTHYFDIVNQFAPDKPLFAWVQSFIDDNWFRYPTPEEFRALVYLNLIHGASQLAWFLYRPSSEEAFEAMGRANAEALQLTETCGLLEPRAPANAGSVEGVHYLVRRSGDKLVLLTLNARNQPAEVTWRLPLRGEARRITVLFEGRSITPDWPDFADRYAPYQRHVYVVE